MNQENEIDFKGRTGTAPEKVLYSDGVIDGKEIALNLAITEMISLAQMSNYSSEFITDFFRQFEDRMERALKEIGRPVGSKK